MKITATSDFKHGRALLRKGKTYDVPPALAKYFKDTGWAEDAKSSAKVEKTKLDLTVDAPMRRKGGDPAVHNADLDVHNAGGKQHG